MCETFMWSAKLGEDLIMQCGELVYRKVPISAAMASSSSGLGVHRAKPPEKETIHSGHFMVSHFEAEAQDDEDELAVPVPDVEHAKLTVVGVTPPGLNAQTFICANKSDKSNNQQLSIETSLTKLFQCMSLAYRQKLTSPKWNRFKGIRLRWKDKIRLNNVIWRCWHMQFITKQKALVCQFASPLDVDTHNKPEAVVLEGKYWKRRLAAVTAEYKKWRLFHRNRVLGWGNKDGSDVLSEIDMLEWQPNSDESMHMLVDEDYMEFMSDTLFSTITANQPFAFPDSREIARAGLADFIQPSLGPLQPNLEDFMDPLEPLQDLIYTKLPPVPEEPSTEDLYRSVNQTYNDLSTFSSTTSNNIQDNTMGVDVSMVSALLNEQPDSSQQTQSNQFSASDLQNTFSSNTFDSLNLYEDPQMSTTSMMPTTTRSSRANQRTNTTRTSSRTTQIRNNNNCTNQAQIITNQLQTPQQVSLQQLFNQSNAMNIQSSLEQQQPQYQPYQTITNINLPDVACLPKSEHHAAFKIPSPPPLMSLQSPTPTQKNQNLMSPGKYSSAMLSGMGAAPGQSGLQIHNNVAAGGDNFKVPALPVQTNWSPPPAQTAPIQTYTNTPVPVQLIQVSDLMQQSQVTPMKEMRSNSYAAPSSTTSKYSTKTRSRARSSSLGPRQTPPPLKSSSSDPALLSHTNSVLLAQLLSNNTQPVYNLKSQSGQPSSSMAATGNLLPALKTKGNVPILSLPSPPATTTLLISTPVSLTNVKTGTSSLSTNQIFMNPLTPSSSFIPSSPKSAPNDSPLSPLSPTDSLGSPGLRNDQSPGPHREQRRVGHIHAEQKRRYNIKNGFDTLHSLIPQLNQNPNAKLSKAAMLQKGAEYIRQLKTERCQLKEEMDSLRQQIECLNTSISNCQSLLPATGAPVSRQRAGKMREMFEEYVRIRTNENWKFWIFSILFEPLLASFNSSVSTSSLDDLYRSTLLWIEQHCSLVDLRPVVFNSLRTLSTKTDILTDPAKLPEEAQKAVANHISLCNNE